MPPRAPEEPSGLARRSFRKLGLAAGLKSRPWPHLQLVSNDRLVKSFHHDAALTMARMLRALLRRARTGSRAYSTIKTDPATCLGPRPDLAHSPLTFDALQYNFDKGRATGQPVCGVVDDFLTETECARLIDLATARGYEPADVSIQHGDQSRKNDKNVINISGRCVVDSQRFADKLWARLAVSASMQPVKELLKSSNPGWTPVGLNSVFRFLRYGPGDYFRPHRDSHFVPEVMDERHGRVTSFQSLLLYLDAPDKGGADRCLFCSRGPMDTASPS